MSASELTISWSLEHIGGRVVTLWMYIGLLIIIISSIWSFFVGVWQFDVFLKFVSLDFGEVVYQVCLAFIVHEFEESICPKLNHPNDDGCIWLAIDTIESTPQSFGSCWNLVPCHCYTHYIGLTESATHKKKCLGLIC